MEPKISIFVLTWNKKELLKRSLDLLIENTDLSLVYELFVVDNGSTDGTDKLVKERYKQFRLIRLEENQGVPGGINAGLKACTGDYIFFVSNDTRVTDKTWLKKSVELLKKKDTGALGFQFTDDKGDRSRLGGNLKLALNPSSVYEYVFSKDLKGKHEVSVDFLLAVAFIVKKEVIKKIGYFDVSFCPFYFEDGDFLIRIKKAGYNIIVTDSIVFGHGGGETTRVFYLREDHFYYGTKNRIRFKLKHYKLSWLLFSFLTEWRYVLSFLVINDNGFKVNKRFFSFLMLYLKAVFENIFSLGKILKDRNAKFVK